MSEDTVETLRADVRRLITIATDRQYMIEALVNMLGPKGLAVWQHWQDTNARRVHYSWEPDARAMTGEERAQVILDINERMKDAKPVKFTNRSRI